MAGLGLPVPGSAARLCLPDRLFTHFECEGSEIARQVATALVEAGIRVVFVTYLHAFAHGLFVHAPASALFLRAERLADGTRTYRMVEGEPLATSHGRDLYERIFG